MLQLSCMSSLLNRDYINPTDRRPMVAGRLGPSRPSLPDFECVVGRWKKYNYSVIISFSSADSFEVLVIGLASADRRPTSNEK